ncbi:MAG: PAS domain S-box protein, partial [Proteobacteria bacterium]|nr:PAS domain S-box protein [Pseudomonadota bacterium]
MPPGGAVANRSDSEERVSVLWVAPEAKQMLRIRAAFETLGVSLLRFDWISDWAAAASQLEEQEFDLLLISEQMVEGLDSGLNFGSVEYGSQPPSMLVIAEEEASRKNESSLPADIERTTIQNLTEVLRIRVLRAITDRRAWMRLIDHHRSFEMLLTAISTRFIQLPLSELDTGIQDALSQSAQFCKVDRAFIMLLADDRKTFSMSYEWSAEDIPKAAQYYQEQPVGPVTWAAERLAAGEVIAYDDLNQLPPEGWHVRTLALSRGVQSVAVVPLFASGVLIGALGFSHIREPGRWSEDAISLLRILGEMLANALQRRKNEAAIHESEIRFRTLVESLGEGILLGDRDDVLLHVNSRMCELSGYSREEMIGARVHEILLPRGEAYKIQERTQRRLQGVSESYSILLQRKDGSRFWAEINAAPIYGADGSIVGTVGAVTDISDRKQALDALQASERKYRDLVETSSDLIWSVDCEGRWRFVNQAALRIYGYEPSEMLGRCFTDFMRPEIAERDILTFQRVLAGEALFHFETEHLRKDQSVVLLSFNAMVLRDRDGRVTGATGTAADITQRKTAEAALSKSEERFKRFFELPLIGVGVSSSERRWLDVNPRFCQMLGYSRDELIGRSWVEFTHPEDLPNNIGVIDRAANQEIDQWSYDKRFIRKDGTILYVTTSGACVRKADGTVDYYLALHQDISERKRSEQEILRQRKFLREVIDASPNVIFAKDRGGRYTLANRSMADAYHTTHEAVVGKTDFDLVDERSAAEFVEVDKRVFETGASYFDPEAVHVDPVTQERRFFQIVKKPLCDAGGKVESILGLAWDITDRKRAEEKSMLLQRQLLQSQKMEAIGQLAAGIAHDLNNALAAVVGHLQLLRMGAVNSEKREHSIDTALTGCKRATSLIEQLLGFSRQGKYNTAPVSLERIARETIDFLRKVLGSDIDIVIESSAQDLIVKGDAGQLQQALTNLIINAKQAMPSGGRITFRFGLKVVDKPEQFNPAAHPGRFCFVRIEDTGVGIPPENVDKVFEPFFTTKAQTNGTGLGLSTVYGMMQGHGGWVELESEVGKGTSFSLFFPEAKGALLEVVAPKTSDVRFSSGTVVIIDDEPVLVELGQEFLKRAGFRTFGFTSSEEGLQWYREHWSE